MLTDYALTKKEIQQAFHVYMTRINNYCLQTIGMSWADLNPYPYRAAILAGQPAETTARLAIANTIGAITSPEDAQ